MIRTAGPVLCLIIEVEGVIVSTISSLLDSDHIIAQVCRHTTSQLDQVSSSYTPLHTKLHSVLAEGSL